MTIIGIAGGIGSGKSVVSRILRLDGMPVYDCDHEARRLMEQPDGDLRRLLSERFGDSLYREDGTLDRARLAAEIFGDESARAYVNTMVHACVKEDFAQWAEREGRRGHDTVSVESAILASSGMTSFCDEVILVEAPEEERVHRAVKRGMTVDDARSRIAAQRAEREQTVACGLPVRMIDNGDSGESLLAALAPYIHPQAPVAAQATQAAYPTYDP